jgi:glycosyltransferase involved in cell wall biosynthesis
VTLRVATLVDHLVAGGAERAAVDIAARLGDDVRSVLITSRLTPAALDAPRTAPTVAELAAAGVEVVAPGRTGTLKAWEWRPVVALLRRGGFDVLHSHSWGSNFWGPALARAAGVPVHVAHDQSPFAGRAAGTVSRRERLVNPWITGRFSDAIVVPSAWAGGQLVAHERVPRRLIRVIPNGAPEVRRIRGRDEVRAELGLDRGDVVVAVAAMLRPEKAHDVAVAALARLQADRPGLKLLLLGAGPTGDEAGTRPALEEQARQLGIADRLVFAGRRSDVVDLVAAADVALLPSARENLPLAVLEYMESGTPVVATTVGGVPELVQDGVHALLVAPGDAAAMAAAIARVLDDPAAAAVRAVAARERRRSLFTWEKAARMTRALYAELLSGRAG